MDNPVEEIKRKIDIVEFVGSFIALKKAGRNFKAICPFHNEKSPSFIVSPERQIWHCFGSCGEGGDIVKFLMKWENITFFEALKELAKKTGVKLKNVTFDDKVYKKKERYYNMNLLASEFFQYVLNKSKFGGKALDYLKGRDIDRNVAEKFRLGYSPVSWDSLRKFLKKKKFEEEEMLENGLLVKSEKGGFYDRFRGRLMFPIMDNRDRVIGFSGRILEGKMDEAKYINTPETPIYHKRETLYGINVALPEIKKEKNAYLVEGEFDMITPYMHGFKNFVAIKGSALTADQLMLLKRFTPKLTLIFDNDEAGVEAAKRAIEEAEKLDVELAVVNFDFAKDPDEAARNDEVAFKKTIANPISIYDFIIDEAVKKYSLADAFGKKKIGDEVIPYIERIANPIVKSHYVKKLSRLLDVPESTLEIMISSLRRKKKQQSAYKSIAKKQDEETREDVIEKYILSSIFQSEDPYVVGDLAFSIVEPADFSIPSHGKIAESFLKNKKEATGKFNLDKFVLHLAAPIKSTFDEVYLFASADVLLPGSDLKKLAYELKRFSLKRQIKNKLSEDGEKNQKDNKELLTISVALKEVEKNLVSL